MQILLDVSPIPAAAEKRTGLARVALSLGQALGRRPDLHLATCAWGSLAASAEFASVRQEFPALNGVHPRQSRLERLCSAKAAQPMPGSRWSRAFWHRAGQAVNQLRNPLAGVRLEDFDVVHSTYARFPRVVRQSGLPTVLTLHDIMPLRLPAARFPAGQVGVTRRIVTSIRPRDWVASVSEWTKADFLDITDHPADRVVVVPNGVDHEMFRPTVDGAAITEMRRRLGIGDGPFVLTLSSLAPHKNLTLLCDVWSRSSRLSSLGTLVVAGGRSTKPDELLSALGVARSALNFVVTGHVTDADFRHLASSCQAFLFPSLYEGFGLPVLEAMACGAPVVASNATSLPEVVGDAGTLLAPDDTNAWEAAIHAALARPLRMTADPDSLARAARFSWDNAAEAYASLYKMAAA